MLGGVVVATAFVWLAVIKWAMQSVNKLFPVTHTIKLRVIRSCLTIVSSVSVLCSLP